MQQKLRDNAISFRNKWKIEDILEQSPDVYAFYKFEEINLPAKKQTGVPMLGSWFQKVNDIKLER